MLIRTAAVMIGLAASGMSGAALAQSSPDGDAARGQALYESTGCYECHGYVGQGGAAGPVIAPPMAFEPFVFQLRQPRLVMIPYSVSVLSDAQAADIYAYLASLPPPADPASIPLLQTMP
jgi:mono/diheme cytochrome c family protein